MTPEGKVKARVKVLLKRYLAYWHMVVQNGMGAPSLDFTVCHFGRFCSIETKAGKGKMTPRQEITAAQIRAAGGTVFLVNETEGWIELEAWLAAGLAENGYATAAQ